MHSDVVAINCVQVSKSFRLFSSPAQMAKHLLGFPSKLDGASRPREFLALSGIDFSVCRGERVALVGLNGAGKTTLLRLILGAVNGNFVPTSGNIVVNGDVEALMHSGVSMHAELSGRENALIGLGYKGLTAEGLAAALDDVIEFVELGDFLDQPISTYSLGMQARLQFAVATAVQPDILIVDEVLGAGDSYFSMKSADRMRRLAFSGCTLLFVSHATSHVLQFCDRAIWLDRGRILRDGRAADVMNEYEAAAENVTDGAYTNSDSIRGAIVLEGERSAFRWPGAEGIRIVRIDMAVNGVSSEKVKLGDSVEIAFEIQAQRASTFNLRYFVTFWNEQGERVARVENDCDSFEAGHGERRQVRLLIDTWALRSGTYRVNFSIYDASSQANGHSAVAARYDVITGALQISAEADEIDDREFIFAHPARWTTHTGLEKVVSS